MNAKEPHGKDPVPPDVHRSDMSQAPSKEPVSGPANAPGNLPEEPETEPLDLSGVIVRRRNWNEPGLVLPFDSYTATATTLAVEPYMNLCSDAGAGTTMADLIDIHVLKDGSGDIAGVPSAKLGKNTLEVSWSKGGDTFRIDFAPYLMVRRFPIPEGTRAHLPVEFKSLKGLGRAMVIHFSQAAFSKIEKGTPRKKKNPEQPQPQPQPQPDQSEPTPDKQ